MSAVFFYRSAESRRLWKAYIYGEEDNHGNGNGNGNGNGRAKGKGRGEGEGEGHKTQTQEKGNTHANSHLNSKLRASQGSSIRLSLCHASTCAYILTQPVHIYTKLCTHTYIHTYIHIHIYIYVYEYIYLIFHWTAVSNPLISSVVSRPSETGEEGGGTGG